MQDDQGHLTLVTGVLSKLRRIMMGWNCMILKYLRWMRAVRRTCRGNGAAKKATTKSVNNSGVVTREERWWRKEIH